MRIAGARKVIDHISQFPLTDGDKRNSSIVCFEKTGRSENQPKEDGYYQAMTWTPEAAEPQMRWLSKDLLRPHSRCFAPPERTTQPTALIPHFKVSLLLLMTSQSSHFHSCQQSPLNSDSNQGERTLSWQRDTIQGKGPSESS
jgi:hypothetical protein